MEIESFTEALPVETLRHPATWAPAGGGGVGQEGALAPPWKFTDMGAPPPRII